MTEEADFEPDTERMVAPVPARDGNWLVGGFLLYFAAVAAIILIFLLIAWQNG